MKYFSKEIIIPIAVIIAIVCLVYMDTNTNTVIAIASVFIAGCALWVSMRADKRNEMQARLSNERIEKHNRLSVKPYLTTIQTNIIDNDLEHVSYKLVNCGVGPAVIKNIILFYKDDEVACNSHQDYHDFMSEKLKDFVDPTGSSLLSGSVIQIGAERVMWEFKYNHLTQNIDFLDELEIFVEYQSIYEDEVFVYDSRDILESKI